MTIQERARELVQLCGASVQARERIVLSLMQEYGATSSAAIQHISNSQRLPRRRRIERNKKPRPYKPCLACGEPILGFPSDINEQLYCSQKCADAGLREYRRYKIKQIAPRRHESFVPQRRP